MLKYDVMFVMSAHDSQNMCCVIFTSSFIVQMPLNTQKSHRTFSLNKEE